MDGKPRNIMPQAQLSPVRRHKIVQYNKRYINFKPFIVLNKTKTISQSMLSSVPDNSCVYKILAFRSINFRNVEQDGTELSSV